MTDLLDRVPTTHRPIIERARDLIDRHVALPFVWPRFLCGISPNFVGLHNHVATDEGRSYDVYPHCAFGHNQSRPRDDRKTTIVFPNRHPSLHLDLLVGIVVHELAHAIDAEHGWPSWRTAVPHTTAYSKTSYLETFAEAFEILVCVNLDGYRGWADRIEADDFAPLRDLVGWRP